MFILATTICVSDEAVYQNMRKPMLEIYKQIIRTGIQIWGLRMM
jgi:hypothetical protein